MSALCGLCEQRGTHKQGQAVRVREDGGQGMSREAEGQQDCLDCPKESLGGGDPDLVEKMGRVRVRVNEERGDAAGGKRSEPSN